MTLLIIIVYDRLHNLKQWFKCWQQCDQTDTHVVVIHNTDTVQYEYQHLCEHMGATYIQRPNIGFDIGAFQDVCRNRLQGFPDWQRLLWVCDDCFPIAKDFIQQYNGKMTEGVGVACMEISPHVRPHIRTSGFMIDRLTAERITFDADPITTKEECWRFEHRQETNHFKWQVEKLGLKVVQVAPNNISPMWDTGYTRRLKRQAEFDKLWRDVSGETITFICPIYKGYPQIISSLIQQTNPNWKLILIHDGPGAVEPVPDDKRITVIITHEHRGEWGHCYRQEYLQKVDTDFVCITNADNFHTPNFIEAMLKGFKPETVGVYCSKMVHSYTNFGVIDCRLERGYIDCAGMVLRTKEASAVGWLDINYHSADWLFFNDLIKQYGKERFRKVEGCLLVHN